MLDEERAPRAGTGRSQAPKAAQRLGLVVKHAECLLAEVDRAPERVALLQLGVRVVLIDRQDVQPHCHGAEQGGAGWVAVGRGALLLNDTPAFGISEQPQRLDALSTTRSEKCNGSST